MLFLMSTVKFSALFNSAGLRERQNGDQWANGTTGFWFLAWVIAMSKEKYSLVGKIFLKI